MTCPLAEIAPEIRGDEELWRAVQSVLGDRAGAIFNEKAKPQSNAGVVRRMVGDLCAYLQGVMAALDCEERRPMCRRVIIAALERIGNGRQPAAYGTWMLRGCDLADFCGEDLLAQCRSHERSLVSSGTCESFGYVPRAIE